MGVYPHGITLSETCRDISCLSLLREEGNSQDNQEKSSEDLHFREQFTINTEYKYDNLRAVLKFYITIYVGCCGVWSLVVD